MESLPVVVENSSLATGGEGLLPAIITNTGYKATEEAINFFVASIRNLNTRKAYLRAVQNFSNFMELRFPETGSLELAKPIHVAAWVENHGGEPQTVKQHLAAVKGLFAWLHSHGAITNNPAASVRGPRYSYNEGKSPCYAAPEIRLILESCDPSTLVGLRDRAFIGIMAFTFSRVSAVCALDRSDYVYTQSIWNLRFSEKGGQERDVPVHHELQQYLDDYVREAGIANGALFRTTRGNKSGLTENRLGRFTALAMVKRRAEDAGLPDANKMTNHSFRASGITAFLSQGGQLEEAQKIAGHATPKTTKLYDHTTRQVLRAHIERIRY